MAARNSLERVLAILEVFTEERLEWTPEQLMEAFGYSRPTLYRYLKTLKDAGLLTSMPNAGFTLGPKVVEMDYLMRKSDPLVLHGASSLKDLTKRYKCTALLVRWYGSRILCVASECSTDSPVSSYPRGRPMPLARGAISRSIMAFLPRRRLVPLVEANLEELRSVGLGTTVEDVLQSLKRVRRVGHAVAHGEVTLGVVGIAAPVFDAASIPIASLCVTIPGAQVASDLIDRIGRRIRQSADEISAELSRDRSPVVDSESHNVR